MEKAASPRRRHPDGARFAVWAAPDGALLRRMDWPQPDGARVRGSLIFAGGRGDFIEKYLEALGHWHDRGWQVTSFDWRGQGASERSLAALGSFDPLVDDLAALLGAWRAAGPPPHVAIGHSMGGHLLLRTIVDRAPALDAAVLVAPMIAVNTAPIPGWLAPAIARVMIALGLGAAPLWKSPRALQRVGSPRQHRLTRSRERYRDELYWWAREPGWDIGAPTCGWLAAAFRSAEAFDADRLAQVTLPILLLAAGHDRLVRTNAIRRAAADLPHASLDVFAGAAHEILRDRDTVRGPALARIDAFLDEQAP